MYLLEKFIIVFNNTLIKFTRNCAVNNVKNYTYCFQSKMGNWQLEVAKMALYMAFPVACFHYFNQPEYFEEWVTKTKREIYPPDSKSQNAEFANALKNIQKEQHLRILKEMEKNSN